MNISTAVGLLLGFGALLAGLIMEEGDLVAFIKPSAMVIVFGGTLGAAIISFPGATVMKIPKMFGRAFVHKSADLVGVAAILVRLSERARREGLLALEDELPAIDNSLLRRGVMLVIDGTDPELVRTVLVSDVNIRQTDQENETAVLEAMGGYAPTMGIIGTVMGLVSVLTNLSDPSQLGGAIAVAFIATFYGVSTANLLWLPIASKLKKQAEADEVLDVMILEGIASIQAGENPRILQERLEPYLPKGRKSKTSEEEEEDAVPTGARQDFQTGQA